MRKVIQLCFILVVIFFLCVMKLEARLSNEWKRYLIEERIILNNLPEDLQELSLWIPYPVSDEWQQITDFKVEGPLNARFIRDKIYGNKNLYFNLRHRLNTDKIEINVSFKISRKEYDGLNEPSTSYKELSTFLKPNKFVPINRRLKSIANKITNGQDDDLEKVRAIYDYIIDQLTYYKGDPRICGIGDSLLTLKYKKGICTDYHSLFISLVRSLEIPAKFEIGFLIPIDIKEGKIEGYHCWAKFYLKDKGWIPVDTSEADKHPEKKDYFFGHIDKNRIHFTTGRDIKLVYAKDKEAMPLNFFIYPYAEVNNKQFFNIDTKVFFKELQGGEK